MVLLKDKSMWLVCFGGYVRIMDFVLANLSCSQNY